MRFRYEFICRYRVSTKEEVIESRQNPSDGKQHRETAENAETFNQYPRTRVGPQ